jgi:hypothetical protein
MKKKTAVQCNYTAVIDDDFDFLFYILRSIKGKVKKMLII